MIVLNLLHTGVAQHTICFTICSFISPDLDGPRAPKMKYCPRRDPQKVSKPKYEATAFTICFSRVMFHDMFHDMFVH